MHTSCGDIDTTTNHPFYVIDKGWVAAGDLVEGDEVYLIDGSTAFVTGAELEKLTEPITVYNLEVADFNTYFVGDEAVLVHNYKTTGNENVDKLIEDLPESTTSKGGTRNFDSSGGYSQTVADFNSLELTDVHGIKTNFGDGLMGILDGIIKVIARPGSKTGGPTLEFDFSKSKHIKIRY